MAVLAWDDTGNKRYETGVDHGVLYPLDAGTGLYTPGVAWNGLTAVNEKPGGAAANPQFADNIKYLNLLSAETFAGTIEAFTYPDEFGPCDGTDDVGVTGIQVGQQGRQTFGLCYRTKVGSDASADLGEKLHLVYGALASPSEKDYSTINDSPAAVGFSWDFDCTPVAATGLEPTALIVIDSTKVDATAYGDLKDLLYGTTGTDPELPDPDTVLALFTGTITAITLSPATFDGAHTITIPSQTGVKYYVDGVFHASGTQVLTTGQKKVVSAVAQPGYVFNKPVVTSWLFTFVS
jgi:hypothetical protein